MTAQPKIVALDPGVHPGDALRETLGGRGLTQRELAEGTGFSESHVSGVVNGRVGIGIEFALALEEFLGIKAEVWLGHQAAYALRLAREG